MDTAKYGKVAAKFLITGKECKGYITSDRQDGTDALKALKDELTEIISKDGRSVKELDFVRSDKLDLNDFAREEGEGAANADSKDLYETAKALLSILYR